MCTLSVAASLDGAQVRVMMNRDERRLRPMASPPQVHATPGGLAVWPTDPASGGSWMAATDRGFVIAVMNVDGHRTAAHTPSRGELAPMFAACASMDAMEAQWRTNPPDAFAPFRMIAIDRDSVAVFEWGARDVSRTRLARAHVFSSSSLGDALVAGPRRALFEELLQREADPWMAQSRFHQHSWPDRRHLSVMMSRANACTVSCTEVLLGPGTVVMNYRPVIEGWPAGLTSRSLTVGLDAEFAA